MEKEHPKYQALLTEVFDLMQALEEEPSHAEQVTRLTLMV